MNIVAIRRHFTNYKLLELNNSLTQTEQVRAWKKSIQASWSTLRVS